VFCRKLPTPCSITILLILAPLSCTRARTTAVERLAIVAFENLSSDSNLNWAGRAVASALVYDLAPAPDLYAQMVDSISGAYTTQASRILEGYLSERNGRMRLVATLEDLATTRTVGSFDFSGSVSEGVLPLLNQLAKRLNSTARPFGTGKLEAFRAYGEVLTSGDSQTILRGLESATVSDPHFVAAYLARARLLLAQGQRDEALKELTAARGANPDAIEAAEIDYFAASVGGNVDGRAKALEILTRVTPADAPRFRELADLRLSQRRFPEAAQDYETAARLAPEQPELWNELGYAYAFGQDLTNARRALEHYGQLLGPVNFNALDSLGEVNFFLGDFSSAEKYFMEAQEKNPVRRAEELMKAAQARLMTGDLGGADATFHKYLGLAQPSQQKTAGFEQSQWEFATGRRKSGMARLEQMIASLGGDQQSLALCQLAIWKLETGSAQAALELGGKAEAMARSPRTRSLSAMCRIMAAPPERPSGSRMADAYALLFARKYADALPLLEAMYREANPTLDGQIRALLAWAEVETGRIGEARKLVEIYPLPLSSGDPVFASLVFPRFLFLRGMVLKDAGKRSDAKQSHELYLKYAGDIPDIFGDEAVARRELAGG
jgi:tetratricopeptide (TPR) repeat protein